MSCSLSMRKPANIIELVKHPPDLPQLVRQQKHSCDESSILNLKFVHQVLHLRIWGTPFTHSESKNSSERRSMIQLSSFTKFLQSLLDCKAYTTFKDVRLQN